MLEITNTGLVTERLNDVIDRLSLAMRDIYGADINISPDTQDGQTIGIWSQGVADINEIISGVYAMSDPTKAIGVWLDTQLKYVGIERNRAAFSNLNDVEFTVVNGTIIPDNYVLTDENGIEWQTTASAKATSTRLIMPLQSVDVGAFHLAGDKILSPKTVVLGVQQVKTTTASVLGSLQESDESALMRFLRSYSINNLDDREGLEASLLALTDVRDAKVYENYTGVLDANGVQPHTINSVVLGGVDEDIAETIRRKKSLGCGLQGAIEVVLFYQDLDRLIRFDRSAAVNISVKVTVVRRSAAIDVDRDAIKKEVASSQFLISEDVIAGSLYCGASSANYKIKEILLTSGDLEDALIIPIGLREHGVILAENVEIEVE